MFSQNHLQLYPSIPRMKPISQGHRIIQKANMLHENLAPKRLTATGRNRTFLGCYCNRYYIDGCISSVLSCHLIASVDIIGGRIGLLSRTRSRSIITAADNLGTICKAHCRKTDVFFEAKQLAFFAWYLHLNTPK